MLGPKPDNHGVGVLLEGAHRVPEVCGPPSCPAQLESKRRRTEVTEPENGEKISPYVPEKKKTESAEELLQGRGLLTFFSIRLTC